MANVEWQKSAADGSIAPKRDIWFPIAIGLLGIIIGYSIGLSQGKSTIAVNQPSPTPPSVPSAPTQPAAPSPLAVPPINASNDHIRGSKDAKVAVIQYSDFECPFSKRVQPTYKQIEEKYGDKVMVVYRHFPLGFHENAQKESEASECVAEIGGNDAFWKFLDGIYEKTTSNGTGFAIADLAPLAKTVGVDEAKFKACLDSGKYAQKVKDEEEKGAAGGVDGTPGNFVVNMKSQKSLAVTGAVPFSEFQTAIDQMLKD
jgi:protein-disulfide isomerase